MKQQLAENMRRIGTKNLDEQVSIAAGTLSDAMKKHIMQLRAMYIEFKDKYVDTPDERMLDLETSKKFTMGMISKIKMSQQEFQNEIKKIYNM